MAPHWVRFLTTALGLAVSLELYGAPIELRIPPAELQKEMAADADSTGGSATVDSGGKTVDTDSAPDAPSADESENLSDESEESEAEGE
jgi:hypothetical protein